MANKYQKGLGGAAQGAAAGASLGSVVPGLGNAAGAVAGGTLGLLGGLFGGDDEAPPSMYSSEEIDRLKKYAMVNPDFNISLAKENPELYRALMKNDIYLKDLQAMYNQRMQGPTAQEQQGVRDYMTQQGSGMASSGMAGTPMGNAMMADAYARQMNPIYDRQFSQQMNLMGQIGQGNQNQFGNLLAGQQGVLAQQNANRQNALGQLQIAQGNQQDIAGFNQGNQFDLGGALMGGVQAYQGIQNANSYGDYLKARAPIDQNAFYAKLNALPDRPVYHQGLNMQPQMNYQTAPLSRFDSGRMNG